MTALDSTPPRGGDPVDPIDPVDVVRRLAAVMGDTSVRRVRLRTAALDVEVERPLPEPGRAGGAVAEVAEAATDPTDAGDVVDVIDVVAPTVGVVHVGAGPDGEPAPAAGAVVEPDTEVARVEAMKMTTAVLAGCHGVVREWCVRDGEVVAFGQPLLRLTAGGADATV